VRCPPQAASAKYSSAASTPTSTPPRTGSRSAPSAITRTYNAAKSLWPRPVTWTTAVTNSTSNNTCANRKLVPGDLPDTCVCQKLTAVIPSADTSISVAISVVSGRAAGCVQTSSAAAKMPAASATRIR